MHTTVEHVTDRGRRVGKGADHHKNTIGLCYWHHFGNCHGKASINKMTLKFGPSLAYGRRVFEEQYGDESEVLVTTQDFMLELFADNPWPEYSVPREVARDVREKWISLNHADR